jgi:hypothetical protein
LREEREGEALSVFFGGGGGGVPAPLARPAPLVSLSQHLRDLLYTSNALVRVNASVVPLLSPSLSLSLMRQQTTKRKTDARGFFAAATPVTTNGAAANAAKGAILAARSRPSAHATF